MDIFNIGDITMNINIGDRFGKLIIIGSLILN